MPVPRHDAIVLCSCGARFGRISRAAACEEMEVLEHALVAAETPRLVRHHKLGHRLALGENAPRSFFAIIAKVAEAMAGEAEEAPERLRLADGQENDGQ